MPAKTFVMVAGEASGDLLASQLISELKQHDPDLHVAGIGGPRMREQGMDIWFDAEELAVMGFAEVLGRLPRLLKVRKQLIRRALAMKPDAFIGIDAPDFNFAVERRMKQNGIPAIHYVSPSIWAWRQKRAKKIVQDTDLVLTLFPFEPDLYSEYGGNARFVGHPLADEIPLKADRAAARASLGITDDRPLIALLPGSRYGEVQRIGPVLAESVAALKQSLNAHFVAALANQKTANLFHQQLGEHGTESEVQTIIGDTQTALIAADLTLIASGTATLEALLCRTPMIVVYRISPITYRIVHDFGLMAVDQYSLPNKLAEQQLVTELMQDNLNAENLASAAQQLLGSEQRLREVRETYDTIHRSLRRNASQRAAKEIVQYLQTKA